MEQEPRVRRVGSAQQLAEMRRRISADRGRLAPYVFRCPRHHLECQEGLGPEVGRLADNSRVFKACPSCRLTYLLEVTEGVPSMLGLEREG